MKLTYLDSLVVVVEVDEEDDTITKDILVHNNLC